MKFEDWVAQVMAEDDYYLPYLEVNDSSANEDDEYIVVQREFYDESRWTVNYRTIFKHRTREEWWEVIFMLPATEMQEGMDTEYSIEGYVEPREVTVTVYERNNGRLPTLP